MPGSCATGLFGGPECRHCRSCEAAAPKKKASQFMRRVDDLYRTDIMGTSRGVPRGLQEATRCVSSVYPFSSWARLPAGAAVAVRRRRGEGQGAVRRAQGERVDPLREERAV